MSELQILNKKLVMDSRDIAELTHKRHADVIRDIRKMFESLANADLRSPKTKQPNPLSYKDKQGKLRPYYLLTYEDTLLLLTGYSIPLRQKVIKRWLYLENLYLKERQNSIKQRKEFTFDLKDRGYSRPHEYIQTTNQMKKELNISRKKNEMSAFELKEIAAAEALSLLLFTDEYGFCEVNPVCVDASKKIAGIVKEKQVNKITA